MASTSEGGVDVTRRRVWIVVKEVVAAGLVGVLLDAGASGSTPGSFLGWKERLY
jgi:hypothetical protein